jgi:hypothetical protein
MGSILLAILPILAQQDPAQAPAPARSLPPQAQVVYLVLAVTLILFLLLFVVIGLNVARRIARRREALRRLHEPQHRSANAESAWAAAGKRVKPITDPRDPTDPTDDPGRLPRRPPVPPDEDDDDDDDATWRDETDLDFGDDEDPSGSAF